MKNGVQIYGLRKRDYPDNGCEICNNKGRLVYHHWDNNNYSQGIWVCYKCHRVIERIDDNTIEFIINKYKEIREGFIKLIELREEKASNKKKVK